METLTYIHADDNLIVENNKNAMDWLNETYKIFKCCLNKKNDIHFLDSHLQAYNINILKNNEILNTFKKASSRLYSFSNNEYKKIINAFYENNIDILIAGSSCLSAVMKERKYQYMPNDIDIYIKNINYDKIIDIDNILHKIYSDKQIYCVRRPITMTWWVFDNQTKDIIIEIQLNLLQIKSWTEVFAVYHSDLVCIGYDILNKNFVFHKQRWNNFIMNYNKKIYMTEIFNCDNKQIIYRAAQKYITRNFDIEVIINGTSNDDNMTFSDTVNFSDLGIEKNCNNIIFHLQKYYHKCDDFHIDIIINNLIKENENPPSLIDIHETINTNPFFEIPYNMEIKENSKSPILIECPVLIENTNLIVCNYNCYHPISLKAYLINNFDKCPLCRIPFIFNKIITADKYENFKINFTSNYVPLSLKFNSNPNIQTFINDNQNNYDNNDNDNENDNNNVNDNDNDNDNENDNENYYENDNDIIDELTEEEIQFIFS